MVKNSSGFEYLPERPKAEDFMHQKWGWRGTEPGGRRAPQLGMRGLAGRLCCWLVHRMCYTRGLWCLLEACCCHAPTFTWLPACPGSRRLG